MANRKVIHWDIVRLFAVLLCCDTTSQISFKFAADHLGEIPIEDPYALLQYLFHLLHSPWLLLGIVAIVIAFFTWLAVISKVDLSKAHLVSCLAYVTVPLASIFLLKEHVTITQMAGVLLIIAGAYIASEHRSQ